MTRARALLAAGWMLAAAAGGCNGTPPQGGQEHGATGAARTAKMGKEPVKVAIPNYDPMPQSPEIDGIGVAIRLSPPEQGAAYQKDEPIYLHGKYGANAETNAQADGAPVTRVVVRVGPEKEEEARGKPVMDAHTRPPSTGEHPKGDFTIYGYFNVNLKKMFAGVIKEEGKYWVTAELFDRRTDKVMFEVKSK